MCVFSRKLDVNWDLYYLPAISSNEKKHFSNNKRTHIHRWSILLCDSVYDYLLQLDTDAVSEH